MTERKKNAKYWKEMNGRSSRNRARAYAKKYGVSMKDAEFQIQYFDMLAQEEHDAIADAMTVYLPSKSLEEE